eukprot:3865768-Lingulodinium_polyedra.AAC.1
MAHGIFAGGRRGPAPSGGSEAVASFDPGGLFLLRQFRDSVPVLVAGHGTLALAACFVRARRCSVD